LHILSDLKRYGVRTMQAEDEIAAIGMAIGASFGGAIGVTATSGPGICLKSEAIGLAVMTELPCVIIDVQRGGPSTGLPTKTEQADLLQAMFGRNGECPAAIVAPCSPADCFQMTFEAIRIAISFMTPVFILSDGYLANGALLGLGWGGTHGAILSAVQRAQRKGHKVACAHFRYLNPMPRNTEAVIRRYKKVLVPELNAGQLRMLLRSMFLVDAQGLNKIQGRPFLVSEIEQKIEQML